MKKTIKQFLSLFSGTTISQLIPLFSTPILTRLYTPEEFGVYAIYIATLTIIYVFATGRYELALLNTTNNESLYNLFYVPIIISFIFNIILLVILILFGNTIFGFLQFNSLSHWKFLIPFSLFMMTIFQTIYLLFNKQEYYNLMAVNLVIQSGSIAIANIILGFSDYGLGLIGGYVIGQLVSTIIIASRLIKLKVINNNLVNFATIKKEIKHHANFPKYLILSHLANRLSLQSSIILFTRFYETNQVGNFSLTHRILKTPLAFIGNTIGQVFRQKASTVLNNKQRLIKLYFSTFLILLVIGFLPFLILFIFSEEIFVFVLGAEWQSAGLYAKFLTPMLFAQFCIGPLTSLFMLSGKQKLDLYWQTATLVLSVLAIIITKFLFNSIEISILSYSMVYVIMYIISFIMTFRIVAEVNK